MFGYVMANRPELKIREYDRYRAYYCGLCRALKKEYGLSGRLTLNYDMTFLVMILAGLYEPESCCACKRCIAHPLSKHEEITSEVSEYAADMNIILAYYNLLDDWKDDRKLSKLFLSLLLRGKMKKACSRRPQKAQRIRELLDRLSELEKAGEENFEEPSGVFGQIMGEVFAYRDDFWKERLYNCGFYLGKFIYLLDAYEDIEEDIKQDKYNPIKPIYREAGFDKHWEQVLTVNIAECTREFEQLPIIDDAEIMRNILYSGVWIRYEKAKGEKA